MRDDSKFIADATAIGNRKAVFTLTEGDVILMYPEGLPADSVAELEDYLKVVMRKIRREAGMPPEAAIAAIDAQTKEPSQTCPQPSPSHATDATPKPKPNA